MPISPAAPYSCLIRVQACADVIMLLLLPRLARVRSAASQRGRGAAETEQGGVWGLYGQK